MIGMSQIKRKLYTGIAIGVIIGVVGIAVILWWSLTTIKSYEAGTNAKYNAVFTKEVVVLNRDIIQGQTITDDMLSTVRVHVGTVPTGAISGKHEALPSNVPGAIKPPKIAKFNIAAYVPITNNMLSDKIMDKDLREQELNTILMPSDLTEGKFIDIRVMFPNGTDYIVLAGKQVNKISGQTMWVSLKENERLILNSAIVDSFLNEGSKLYATVYSDPEAQIKYEAESQDLVRGELIKLIEDELPELTNLGGAGEVDENATPQTNRYVDKLLDFILKYNNLATATSQMATTYQPNSNVISAMKGNPNISMEAVNRLSQDIRSNIESLNLQYERENEKRITNVVSGAQASISEQRNQRMELLNEF